MTKKENERLAICETMLKEIKKDLENHLQHHFWFNMTLLGAVVVEAAGFLILVLKQVL